MAQELAKRGHAVYVVAASFTHLLRNQSKQSKPFEHETHGGVNFVWVRVPRYSLAKSKIRIINWFIFSLKLLWLSRVIKDKPDVVWASSPQPFLFLSARRLARKLKARLVFEVRDIWPLTLQELGGLSEYNPLILAMRWIERVAYRDSDAVISNLPNAIEHMAQKGLCRSKFTWITNGICLNEMGRQEEYSAKSLEGFSRGRFTIGYVGTLGLANSLHFLINAIASLKNEINISLVLVGAGGEQGALKGLVDKLGLNKSVLFLGAIPKQQVQSVMAHFDVCYIGWQNLALYRYGVSPNKLPEYLFSGVPIVNSYSGFFDVVADAGAGLSAKAEDSDSIANAIKKLYFMGAEKRQALGDSGKRYALEHLTYAALSLRAERVLFDEDNCG